VTPELSLADKVVAVHQALTRAEAAHAFGGALALAYYAEPRATIDIDVNLFVAPEARGPIVAALDALGLTADLRQAERDGQVRVMWGRTPLDLFFSYLPLHEAMREQVRTVPFGDGAIPILSPEHLLVCKAPFNRPKDWLDIEQVAAAATGLNHVEISRWMREIVGEADERSVRIGTLLSDGPTHGGAGAG